MSRSVSRHPNLLAALVFASLAVPTASNATAEMVTYVVDPARSALTLSGYLNGQPLIQHLSITEDSLTAAYMGTICADRESDVQSIRISAGTIRAIKDGNYGFSAWGKMGPFVYAEGTLRDFSLELSPLIMMEPVFFPTSLVYVSVSSGRADLQSMYGGSFFGDIAHSSYDFSNKRLEGPNQGSLCFIDGVETLILPLDTEMSFLVDGGSLTLHFTGVVTATAPEPSSLAFLSFPMLLLLRWRSVTTRSRERL